MGAVRLHRAWGSSQGQDEGFLLWKWLLVLWGLSRMLWAGPGRAEEDSGWVSGSGTRFFAESEVEKQKSGLSQPPCCWHHHSEPQSLHLRNGASGALSVMKTHSPSYQACCLRGLGAR